MFVNLIKKIGLIILVTLFFYTPLASASFEDFYVELDEYFNENYIETVVISNNLKASSNTGGNIAEGGEVINGKTESSIKVRTIINGEVVEDFEKKETNSKENQEIIYDSKIEMMENKINIETKKEINGEVEEIKKEFDLGDTGIKEVNKASIEIEEIIKTQMEEGFSPEILASEEKEATMENEEQKTLAIFKYLNIILDILKNNIDRISKLF